MKLDARQLTVSLAMIVVAILIVTGKPLIIDLLLPLAGGHGGGLSGELAAANTAANISGGCDIVASILALIGAWLLVRQLFRLWPGGTVSR